MTLPIRTPHRRQRRPTPAPAVSSPGFTLVEVLVAALLVATVVANVAALCAIATRAAAGARQQTSTSLLATQKMEQLLALTWSSAGSLAVPVSDLTSDISGDPPTGAGLGLTPSPPGSLDRNVPGYVDYLDAAGTWVGTGAAPPPRAVFVRRWSIDALPSDPDNMLVLQVFVTTVDAARRQSDGRHVHQPGDAFVVDVKTRMGP